MPQERTYTTNDLVNTYIASQKPNHVDFVNYYNGLLTALQKAFDTNVASDEGVESKNRAIHMLFQATIRSFIAIRTPGSTFLDGSLIQKRLEITPIGMDVQRLMGSINEVTEENINLHRALIETLFSYLYKPKVTAVTSQDLYNLGFDDSTEPNLDDYEY